jgi:small-conductance mechanosensitive channel
MMLNQYKIPYAMLRKIIVLLIIAGLSALAWFLNLKYDNVELDKLVYTLLALTISYFIFRFPLEEPAAKYIHDSKARYSFRKAVSLLFIVVSFVVILRVWIINPQALLVAYGLVAAGVAISLQDIFKNFAGGIIIFLTGAYQVGNRIAINGKSGDVIDIGLFYTTILEIREWVDGDQATGRLTSIPNGYILSCPVDNYTKDHLYIWDEIKIPLTYESDWKTARALIIGIATRETQEDTLAMEKSLGRLEEKYYLDKKRAAAPDIYKSYR